MYESYKKTFENLLKTIDKETLSILLNVLSGFFKNKTDMESIEIFKILVLTEAKIKKLNHTSY